MKTCQRLVMISSVWTCYMVIYPLVKQRGCVENPFFISVHSGLAWKNGVHWLPGCALMRVARTSSPATPRSCFWRNKAWWCAPAWPLERGNWLRLLWTLLRWSLLFLLLLFLPFLLILPLLRRNRRRKRFFLFSASLFLSALVLYRLVKDMTWTGFGEELPRTTSW